MEKKSAKFWAPTPRAPTLPAQFFLGPTHWAMTHIRSRIGLAKIGLAQIGQIRMAQTGLAKVGLFPKRPPHAHVVVVGTTCNVGSDQTSEKLFAFLDDLTVV